MMIFIDTSALYALMDADDRNHERARDAWTQWLDQPMQFLTSNYVLLESTALIQHRLGIQAARLFEEEFVPVLSVHWVDADIHTIALKTMLAIGKRDLSLVNCTNIEIMRRLGHRTIFAFDRHYPDQGLTQLP
jgi:predicted nucleic acid-binding protein